MRRLASLFTRIIEGDLPAHFVWKDEVSVGFLSIAPLKPGHTLVVPRVEVDHWLDLEPDVVKHLAGVTHAVGKAIARVYDPVKVGSIILGLEVPHVHIHVAPIWSPTDLDFHNANPNTKPEALAIEADRVRGALRELGYAEVSD
jgi:histidine triad (HIT) family protein